MFGLFFIFIPIHTDLIHMHSYIYLPYIAVIVCISRSQHIYI